MILAPRFAMAWQIAEPIPPEAPVTSAVIWVIVASVPARPDLRDPLATARRLRSRRARRLTSSTRSEARACADRAAGTATLGLESAAHPASVDANENLTFPGAGHGAPPRDAARGLCLLLSVRLRGMPGRCH